MTYLAETMGAFLDHTARFFYIFSFQSSSKGLRTTWLCLLHQYLHFFLVSVSVLLVSCCNKISYQKQLWEERIYFGLQFLRDTTHHDKEVHLHFIRKHRINRKWGQGIQPQSLPLGTYL